MRNAIRCILLSVMVTIVCAVVLTGQAAKTKVFVAPPKAQDELTAERFKFLLIENLQKLKQIEVTSSKDSAEILLDAVAIVENRTQVSTAEAGEGKYASLSVKLTNRDGRILAATDKSNLQPPLTFRDPVKIVASDIVDELKKKMKWK